MSENVFRPGDAADLVYAPFGVRMSGTILRVVGDDLYLWQADPSPKTNDIFEQVTDTDDRLELLKIQVFVNALKDSSRVQDALTIPGSMLEPRAT